MFFDNYGTGEIDVKDFEDASAEVQAAFLGHHIEEWFETENYEAVKAKVSKEKGETWNKVHGDKGLEKERNIMKEMTGKQNLKKRNEAAWFPAIDDPKSLESTFDYGQGVKVKFKVERNSPGTIQSQEFTNQ